jgi:hypothetical protein
MGLKVFLMGAVAALAVGAAHAATVTYSNTPDGGTIAPFGFSDTQTYGEVFTPTVSGTLTSFTLSLTGGVGGDLAGAVGTWNGGASYGLGFGSPSTLYVSAPISSGSGGAFTFAPDVSVTAGDTYVAFLSVYGLNATTTTSMPSAGGNPAGIDYFVWNNTSSPYGNTSWNYFYPTNAQFAYSVSTVPEPSTWAMMGLGFAGLAFAGYRARRTAIAAA